MAKKYQQRAHVSVRKKKEEEVKRQRRKDYVKNHLKQIISLMLLAVVLLAGVILLADYCNEPDGAMRVFMGKLQGAEENAVIANFGGSSKPVYYTVAWYEPEEGYVSDPTFFTSSDGKEQRLMYRAEDENQLVNNISLSGIHQKTAAQYIEQLRAIASSGGYTTYTETREADVAGKHLYYIYTTTVNTYEDPETGLIPDQATASIVAYTDTIQDSCVYMGITSRTTTQAELPGEEELFAAAQEHFAQIRVLKPDGTISQ